MTVAKAGQLRKRSQVLTLRKKDLDWAFFPNSENPAEIFLLEIGNCTPQRKVFAFIIIE